MKCSDVYPLSGSWCNVQVLCNVHIIFDFDLILGYFFLFWPKYFYYCISICCKTTLFLSSISFGVFINWIIDGSVFIEQSVKSGEHCRNSIVTLRKMPLQTLEEEKKFKIPTWWRINYYQMIHTLRRIIKTFLKNSIIDGADKIKYL